jgi:hypothetical protein
VRVERIAGVPYNPDPDMKIAGRENSRSTRAFLGPANVEVD